MNKKKEAGPTKNFLGAFDKVLAEFEESLNRLSGDSVSLSGQKNRQARAKLEEAARRLVAFAESLDVTRRPKSVFDPSNPALFGRFVALTLIAQDRVQLSMVPPFYGSGVYAIYYKGPFTLYRPIRNIEHPIYVGKADPAIDGATTSVLQGRRLWSRLKDHQKNISKSRNLKIEHFECRFLVVASGWQKAAEEYLIQLFSPIWNSEMRLVYGLGKHGDAASTRGNRRSPWDTLHPGRRWAKGTKSNQKSIARIRSQLELHFKDAKPYKNLRDIFARFMSEMHQLPTVSSSTNP